MPRFVHRLALLPLLILLTPSGALAEVHVERSGVFAQHLETPDCDGFVEGLESLGEAVVDGLDYIGTKTLKLTEGVGRLVTGDPSVFVDTIDESFDDLGQAAATLSKYSPLALVNVLVDALPDGEVTNALKMGTGFIDGLRAETGRSLASGLNPLGTAETVIADVREIGEDLGKVLVNLDDPESAGSEFLKLNQKWTGIGAFTYMLTEDDPMAGLQKGLRALHRQVELVTSHAGPNGKVAGALLEVVMNESAGYIDKIHDPEEKKAASAFLGTFAASFRNSVADPNNYPRALDHPFYKSQDDLVSVHFRGNDAGSGGDHDFGFYHADVDTRPGCISLGDYSYGAKGRVRKLPALCGVEHGRDKWWARPIDFQLVWGSNCSGSDLDLSIWQPVCGDGYTSVGMVVGGGSWTKPLPNSIACLKEDLSILGVANGQAAGLKWVANDTGSGAKMDVTIYMREFLGQWLLYAVPTTRAANDVAFLKELRVPVPAFSRQQVQAVRDARRRTNEALWRQSPPDDIAVGVYRKIGGGLGAIAIRDGKLAWNRGFIHQWRLYRMGFDGTLSTMQREGGVEPPCDAFRNLLYSDGRVSRFECGDEVWVRAPNSTPGAESVVPATITVDEVLGRYQSTTSSETMTLERDGAQVHHRDSGGGTYPMEFADSTLQYGLAHPWRAAGRSPPELRLVYEASQKKPRIQSIQVGTQHFHRTGGPRSLESLCGSYDGAQRFLGFENGTTVERREENVPAWATGSIEVVGNALRWTNDAGESWGLRFPAGQNFLVTNSGNPHQATSPNFLLHDRMGGGFDFHGRSFLKRTSCSDPRAKEDARRRRGLAEVHRSQADAAATLERRAAARASADSATTPSRVSGAYMRLAHERVTAALEPGAGRAEVAAAEASMAALGWMAVFGNSPAALDRAARLNRQLTESLRGTSLQDFHQDHGGLAYAEIAGFDRFPMDGTVPLSTVYVKSLMLVVDRAFQPGQEERRLRHVPQDLFAMGWLTLFGNRDESLTLADRLEDVAKGLWPGPGNVYQGYTKAAYANVGSLVYWTGTDGGVQTFQEDAAAPAPAQPSSPAQPETFRDADNGFRFQVAPGWTTGHSDPNMAVEVSKGEDNNFGVAMLPPGTTVKDGLVALATGLRDNGNELTKEFALTLGGFPAGGVEFNVAGGGEGALVVCQAEGRTYAVIASFKDAATDPSLQAGFSTMIQSFQVE